jgi:hypothetical protein
MNVAPVRDEAPGARSCRIATWRKSKAPCGNVVGVRLDGPGDEAGVATAWRPSSSIVTVK